MSGTWIRRGKREIALQPGLANRHGMVAGAIGTGTRVTLQVLAEKLARIGVPVFVPDARGDLSHTAASGSLTAKLQQRLSMLGVPEPSWAGCPLAFRDVFGGQGHPKRGAILPDGSGAAVS